MKRSTRLEEYLKENCSYDVLSNPKNMAEVDFSTTPVPIVKLFYRSGDGEYPEDQHAYFEPPEQDSFSVAFYRFSRKRAEGRDERNFRHETRDAWIQRCKKAWASIVRDVHFAYLVFEDQEETAFFDSVEFSVEKDINEGADLIVNYESQTYHINLFVDSSKSRDFLNRKKDDRQPDKQETDVEVPMTFNGPKKSIHTEKDDIWLYSDDHVEAVKDVVSGSSDHVKKNGYTLAKPR